MNDEEKARYYLELMYQSRPKSFVQKVDTKSRGLQILLYFLYRSTGEICAGDLSKEFNVSTARVTVALKNLLNKGFIVTSGSAADKRKVIVEITETGRAEVEKNIDELIDFTKLLMREIGEDDLKEFLRIFAKINALCDKAYD